MDILFAEIVLPLPLGQTFTYKIPNEFKAQVAFGVRVVVPFGRNKLYTGIVVAVHADVPSQLYVKPIVDVVDERPIITEKQYELWQWTANYYLCTLGEVVAAALPSGLKLASETQILFHPNFEGDISEITEYEAKVVDAITNHHQLSLRELSKQIDIQKVFPIVKSLMEKEILIAAEEIKDHYKPKCDAYIVLHNDYAKNIEALYPLIDQLEKKKATQKQAQLLLAFLTLGTQKLEDKYCHKKSDLIAKADVSASSLQTLIKNNILKVEQRRVSRLVPVNNNQSLAPISLSPVQEEKFAQIKEHWRQFSTVLFHGITGSGKTEIYIKLIDEVLQQGKQVLYLLPEIALTTQIVNRLRKYFGNQVAVYHSRFNEFERIEIWDSVLHHQESSTQKFNLVLGARSSLLLPFNNLGLIIVDEEHDASYKQHDPSPRYHARDLAIVAAQMHQAKVLLGTATPSLESYYNVKQKKFGYVELNERYAQSTLPDIWIENMLEAQKQKKVQGNFSQFLIDHVGQALERKEQVIIFQNRRGYALRCHCDVCGHIPVCQHCDVTLTYHKASSLLKCHYCGYAIELPKYCPNCQSPNITMKGIGTEKVEEHLQHLFPGATVARLDADTSRAKTAYQRIISDFEQQKTQILVGTQMVTKGLDFGNVSVVGILDADSLLSYPDFRSFERAFQIMAQVSGRAGRKNVHGNVIIQTYQPYHKALQYIAGNHYLSMYNNQIEERINFMYPPVYRMIKITLKDKEEKKINEAAQTLFNALVTDFKGYILGPANPIVARVQTYFLKDIWIKLPKSQNLEALKGKIAETIYFFKQDVRYKSVRININVDC